MWSLQIFQKKAFAELYQVFSICTFNSMHAEVSTCTASVHKIQTSVWRPFNGANRGSYLKSFWRTTCFFSWSSKIAAYSTLYCAVISRKVAGWAGWTGWVGGPGNETTFGHDMPRLTRCLSDSSETSVTKLSRRHPVVCWVCEVKKELKLARNLYINTLIWLLAPDEPHCRDHSSMCPSLSASMRT